MNTVVNQKSLQERVGDRIKDQIGELLTDDDVKKLVETAIQDAFFKPQIKRNPNGYGETTQPPYIVDVVKGLMQERISAAMDKYLAGHADEVTAQIDEMIGKGMFGIVQGYLEGAMRNKFINFGQELRNVLQSKGIQI